jgi:DNA mismatch repair protein MLH1
MKALEGECIGVLPQGTFPLIYLRCLNPLGKNASIYSFSIEIDPRSVDLNVHPTTREVHFVIEDAIMKRIARGACRPGPVWVV